MNDLEIANSIELKKITEIAGDLDVSDEIELYGNYKAKINLNVYNKLSSKKDGKLILVTAINPTKLGEGKTTMSIAIADGLRKINKKSILALREPSLGPVFGIKGGATGGGFSQVAPMADINLHFTGDIHALTSANNLLCSVIDNHIYFGNELKFKRVVFKRCLDLNDRQLRCVNTGLSNEKNIVSRIDSFDITVASEVMAIFCLATSLDDLKRRLGNIIVGYNINEEPIYARDLKCEGAMAVLLKDALKPNLVQTLEHTPAIIHGGPFANIAHGCNSIIATKMALKLGDYVITEAGFGADLGAEKFLDIKCPLMNTSPDAVVLVVTIKALKYHGGKEIEKISEKDFSCLEKGLINLFHHYNNIKNKYGLNIIVGVNKYNNDNEDELNYLINKLEEKNILYSLITGYKDGGKGAVDIAKKLVNLVEEPYNFKPMYENNLDIKDKINSVCKNIYGSKEIVFSDEAEKNIEEIRNLGFNNLPICIAKTQYSLGDDPKKLGSEIDTQINIRKLEIKNGAGFIVVFAGNIMTMPGLPKKPNSENINLDENGLIKGIF